MLQCSWFFCVCKVSALPDESWLHSDGLRIEPVDEDRLKPGSQDTNGRIRFEQNMDKVHQFGMQVISPPCVHTEGFLL